MLTPPLPSLKDPSPPLGAKLGMNIPSFAWVMLTFSSRFFQIKICSYQTFWPIFCMFPLLALCEAFISCRRRGTDRVPAQIRRGVTSSPAGAAARDSLAVTQSPTCSLGSALHHHPGGKWMSCRPRWNQLQTSKLMLHFSLIRLFDDPSDFHKQIPSVHQKPMSNWINFLFLWRT